MSKRFKGKTCAYCAAEGKSQTGDHIFAREFFLPNRRANLPQVPACERCNNTKSRLEHYLTAVLPFGGQHKDAVAALQTMVPNRLSGNLKLHSELTGGFSDIWLSQGGEVHRTLSVPFDGEKLLTLFRYIVRGLVVYHWGEPLPPDQPIGVSVLTGAGERIVGPLLRLNGSRVHGSLGEDTFAYEGVRSVETPLLSIWRFTAYGGALFADDTSGSPVASSGIWATTAPEPMPLLFDGHGR